MSKKVVELLGLMDKEEMVDFRKSFQSMLLDTLKNDIDSMLEHEYIFTPDSIRSVIDEIVEEIKDDVKAEIKSEIYEDVRRAMVQEIKMKLGE